VVKKYLIKNVKVECTLEEAMKTQRKTADVSLYSFFNLGARSGWMFNATPLPLYARDRDPAPIV
jgi:hypothetical protein